LPFVVLVIADAIARPDQRPIEDRRPVRVTGDGFEKAMAECRLSVEISLPLPGARVSRDEACHVGDDRSLAALVLGNRILHEGLNVQGRRRLDHDCPVPQLVDGMNAGLSRRLARTGIGATVETTGTELAITIRLPSDGAPRLLTRRLPLPKGGD